MRVSHNKSIIDKITINYPTYGEIDSTDFYVNFYFLYMTLLCAIQSRIAHNSMIVYRCLTARLKFLCNVHSIKANLF